MTVTYERLIEQARRTSDFASLYELGMPRTVYEVLRWTARQNGDRAAWAFIDEGISKTWNEVLQAVDKTASALFRAGVRPASHVAIMVNNIEAFPLCWLALAKIGATIVPINTAYTEREVEHALTLSESQFIVIENEFLPIFEQVQHSPVAAENTLVVGAADVRAPYQSWERLLEQADVAPMPCEVSPDSLLNIQFTSGTTGFAKGCMLTHEYWLVLGLGSSVLFGDTMTRIYMGQSFYYMVSQRLLMNAMLMGAELIIPRRPGSKRFMPDVIQYECDYCSMFEMAYKQGLRIEDKRNHLKLATIFGFNQAAAQNFEQVFDTQVQEFYGMTEIGGALYMPRDVRPTAYASGTCGVVAPFRQVRVCDPDGNELPDGKVGELCVRGPGIMLAYYRNEAATADVFHGDWFRTGDLFVKEPSGHYRIVGRSKDMVRRNGENIPAQEVEAVIRSLPEVSQAAVIPVPDDYCGEEVKVYIQLNDGVTQAQLPVERLIEHARANMAAFKVPRYYTYVERFELTDSLRVRKKSLTEGVADLRLNAYDAKDQCWR
ncbi:class I adenylate-forming enzyme family protein [Bordetella sp. 15P40C-2]|uniref:class I adenylate-forming enzyme family protein n=1 Tax=Bordetella sp. 15P40C-2 TaxID=2572246 RepID=UPI00132BFC59|nr:class I adenylate-forming enzyme family protein [Bordetella sp. 15P40C-2]MVW70506.1 AMP-binding protein [Bordetella sp. 15P40C-2]